MLQEHLFDLFFFYSGRGQVSLDPLLVNTSLPRLVNAIITLTIVQCFVTLFQVVV